MMWGILFGCPVHIHGVMEKIDNAVRELHEMDELTEMDSPVHSLHPLSKLAVTIAYILITVSFGKYELSGLFVMLLYPVLMFQFSGVKVSAYFRKMKYVILLVVAVGIFNPFFDRQILFRIGNVAVSGGTVSMISLMLKGVFCLSASFLLAATTSIDSLCAALRKIHLPKMFVSLILLTYRYITVMAEEVSVMNTAYRLRAPGQKGIHYKAWGTFLGQLLLRSMDKAEELHNSMLLRGFRGEFWYAEPEKSGIKDYLYVIISIALFFVLRYVNIAELIGRVVTGGAV